ncbi:MAG: DUF5615 family PIN-like protein [Xanthobacteraceae bacterium]
MDMPLSPALAQWLIDAGHEAIHVSDIGMARASDTEIVARAKREGRTVITADSTTRVFWRLPAPWSLA